MNQCQSVNIYQLIHEKIKIFAELSFNSRLNEFGFRGTKHLAVPNLSVYLIKLHLITGSGSLDLTE